MHYLPKAAHPPFPAPVLIEHPEQPRHFFHKRLEIDALLPEFIGSHSAVHPAFPGRLPKNRGNLSQRFLPFSAKTFPVFRASPADIFCQSRIYKFCPFPGYHLLPLLRAFRQTQQLPQRILKHLKPMIYLAFQGKLSHLFFHNPPPHLLCYYIERQRIRLSKCVREFTEKEKRPFRAS